MSLIRVRVKPNGSLNWIIFLFHFMQSVLIFVKFSFYVFLIKEILFPFFPIFKPYVNHYKSSFKIFFKIRECSMAVTEEGKYNQTCMKRYRNKRSVFKVPNLFSLNHCNFHLYETVIFIKRS